MKTFTHVLQFQTQKFLDIIDITEHIHSSIQDEGIENGIVNVFCKHTTSTIKINENEEGFFKDLEDFCQKFAPHTDDYKHNHLHSRDPKTLCVDRDECLNGHSHILQMFIGTASETVPLVKGKLALGTWQRLLLVELDSSRNREVIVQVLY